VRHRDRPGPLAAAVRHLIDEITSELVTRDRAESRRRHPTTTEGSIRQQTDSTKRCGRQPRRRFNRRGDGADRFAVAPIVGTVRTLPASREDHRRVDIVIVALE
jgi:hypothetical protein